MQTPTFDPGLTKQVIAPLRRIIGEDGRFNVHRRGTTWRDFHPYLHLVNMSWPRFMAALFVGYIVINSMFAGVYFALGPEQLSGADASNAWGRFLNDFFFSSHTLSTVGYGNISPKGMGANLLATFEALVGVLGFAVATGLLFGRVSRPSARIGFSENLLVAPYQDGTSLQFRMVNRRSNSLMELEAKVMLMTVDTVDGKLYTYCSEVCRWTHTTAFAAEYEGRATPAMGRFAGRREWEDCYHGWDLADAIVDLGFVRNDGKTLVPQPHLHFDNSKMWTLDHVRGNTLGSPLRTIREMTPEARDKHIAEYRAGYTITPCN